MKFAAFAVLAAVPALALSCAAYAQSAGSTSVPPSGSAPVSPATLTATLDAILNVPALRHATIGVLVRSLPDGAVLYEKNADLSLNPASCEKLFTVSALLNRVGPAFTYLTTVSRAGTLTPDGQCDSVWLRGNGDPSLTGADLAYLAGVVHSTGVRSVGGFVGVDATRFDRQGLGVGWEWDDEPFEYAAQLAAVNVDENVVSVEVRPTAADAATAVVLDSFAAPVFSGTPTEEAFLRIANTAVVNAPVAGSPAQSKISVSRIRGSNTISVSGSVDPSTPPTKAAVTAEDPARFNGFLFAWNLRRMGVATPPDSNGLVALGQLPENVVQLAQRRSAPLSVLAWHCLKESDNFYAEAFLKTLGAETTGVGTAGGGAGVVRAFLAESGIDTSGIAQVDGSGLSRHDFATARTFADLLSYMDAKAPPAIRDIFEFALPIAGVDGTLRRRAVGTSAQGRVRAKTGTLNGVSCLSGYATARSGRKVAFSLLFNGLINNAAAARAAQDAVMSALCDR